MESQELYRLQDPVFGKADLLPVVLPFKRKRKHSTTKIQSSSSSNANVQNHSHPFPFFSFFNINGYFDQFDNSIKEKKIEPNCTLTGELAEQKQQ